MFDQLLRELAARFNLVGDKAITLLQMLIGHLTDDRTGGIGGFFARMTAAGLGDVARSWADKSGGVQRVAPADLESVLAGSGGANLVSDATEKLGIERDIAVAALAFMLPVVVSKLTPGGTAPNTPPMAKPTSEPPVAAAAVHKVRPLPAGAGAGRADAGAAGSGGPARARIVAGPPDLTPSPERLDPAVVRESRSGMVWWLAAFLLAAAAAAWYGWTHWPAFSSGMQPASVATPSEPAPTAMAGASDAVGSSAEAPSAPGVATGPGAGANVDAATAASTAGSAASDATASPAESAPMLIVYFGSGRTTVDKQYDDQYAEVAARLKQTEGARAVVAGYSDPSGNAVQNAELARRRAQAVFDDLVAAGVPAGRVVLETPPPSEPAPGARNSELRRVEVTIRN